MLIAVCGIDGAGKTTQINLLKKYFEKSNKTVLVTKQPTDFYRKYDRLKKYKNRIISTTDTLICEELALLSAADKLRHYQEIKCFIDSQIVISDRYVYSAFAYFLARGLKLEWLKMINSYLPEPDLTICIDLDPQIAMKRVEQRDRDFMDNEEKDLSLLEVVRETFMKQPWGTDDRYYIVDGNQDVVKIHRDILAIVEKMMKGD